MICPTNQQHLVKEKIDNMKYVRFRMDNEVRYGILNGEIIAVLDGDLLVIMWSVAKR